MLHLKRALSKIFLDMLSYTWPRARKDLSQALLGVKKKNNLKIIE